MEFVERIPLVERKLSSVSYLEVVYGCRNQEELHRFRQHISSKYADVLPLSRAITTLAQQLMERFALSRRPDVSDVLIAATALNHGEAVATGNLKHFDFVPGLEIKVFRP